MGIGTRVCQNEEPCVFPLQLVFKDLLLVGGEDGDIVYCLCAGWIIVEDY